MSAAETPTDLRASRKLEILDLLARGMTSAKIAAELGCTQWTVRLTARKAGLRKRGTAASGTTDYRESDTARRKRLDLERAAMFRCPRCMLIEPCLTNHDEKPDPWRRR